MSLSTYHELFPDTSKDEAKAELIKDAEEVKGEGRKAWTPTLFANTIISYAILC